MNPRHYFLAFFLALTAAPRLFSQCTTDAGLVVAVGPTDVCSNLPLEIVHENQNLDSNDVCFLVIHTDPNLPFGTRVAQQQDFSAVGPTTISFAFDANLMQTGVTYYVSAIAGNSDGAGFVDGNDLCLSESQPISFVWREAPTVDLLDYVLTCANPSVQVSVSICPLCTILWSNGSTSPQTNLNAGTYCCTVTNQYGCSTSSCGVVVQDGNAPLISVTPPPPISCINPCVTLIATASSGPQFTIQWLGPNFFVSNVLNPIVCTPGIYTAILTNAQNGCTSTATVQVNGDPNPDCNLLKGSIRCDSLDNCTPDALEKGLQNWIVEAKNQATGQSFFGTTDSLGFYGIGLPTGDFIVKTVVQSPFWQPCVDSLLVQFPSTGDTATADFLEKKLQNCPSMTVDISTSQLRRCFSNNYYLIKYSNLGTTAALGVDVEITLDPFLSPVAASVPFTDLGGGKLLFSVGDVAFNSSGSFWLKVMVSCDAVLGQTHCTMALIEATNTCADSLANNLILNHLCQTDSLRFTIKNGATTGPAQPLEYVVIEDAVMRQTTATNLSPNQEIALALPANGSTWRVEARPTGGGGKLPIFRSVEGCGTNGGGSFSTGFVNQFPQNNGDPITDVDCTANIGSYDPNDKSAQPIGFGAAQLIDNQTLIEYKIRFQNTGTDTAFHVVVRDTLPAALDPTTIRLGPSSHFYTMNLTGKGELIFDFENIQLPDSTTNLAASQGFVSFQIKPRAGLADGTTIENRAAIFFDFNEPVLTNAVHHTIGHAFVSSGLWLVPNAFLKMTVAPNPFHETAIFEVENFSEIEPNLLIFKLLDAFGRIVRVEKVNAPRFEIHKNGLADGLYFFQLETEIGREIGRGKVVVR